MGTATEQQMMHITDSHLDLCSWPLSHISSLAVMEHGTGGGNGEWRGAMAAFYIWWDEKGWEKPSTQENREGGRGDHSHAHSRDRAAHGMQLFGHLELWDHALRSEMVEVVEVRWFGGGEDLEELCMWWGTQRQWSVWLTTTSVVLTVWRWGVCSAQ